MYAIIATALAFAGLSAAAPTLEARQESEFRLRATGTLAGWALINAHVDAGRNVIQIQRPSVYQSDISYLNGTNLFFDLGATIPYSVQMPDVPAGDVAQVFTQPGDHSTGFGLDATQLLTYNSNNEGFWACPVNNVFELFYGLNPVPANLPSTECLEIQLQAGAI
ncbi:glycosylphosphatidylinositol anchor biosynthesis [Hypoxylon texense]